LKIRLQIEVINMNSQNKSGGSHDDPLVHEFLTAIDLMVGKTGRYLQIRPNGDPPFWIVAYNNVPSDGSITAFTFGVSSVPNDAWRLGRPEIVINVDSVEDDWLLSLGAISASLRGVCPFSLGNVLRFGKPLSSQSDMSAFFLFWPTILEKDQSQLRLSDRLINFIQAYPIFDSEGDMIDRIGAEKFFMTDGLEFSDVTRAEFDSGVR